MFSYNDRGQGARTIRRLQAFLVLTITLLFLVTVCLFTQTDINHEKLDTVPGLNKI